MHDKEGPQYSFTTNVDFDEDDNFLLDFPDELLEALGWEEGDTLEIQAFAGRLIFRKVPSDD